jgi:hypothetical protein
MRIVPMGYVKATQYEIIVDDSYSIYSLLPPPTTLFANVLTGNRGHILCRRISAD